MNEFAINWIFFCDTMNFSFWSDNELIPPELNDKVKSTSLERYTVIYKGIPYHGYWALCAAINRALDVRKIYLELKVNEFYLDFYKGRFSHY
jgi:hypothetical protein